MKVKGFNPDAADRWSLLKFEGALSLIVDYIARDRRASIQSASPGIILVDFLPCIIPGKNHGDGPTAPHVFQSSNKRDALLCDLGTAILLTCVTLDLIERKMKL